MDDSRVNFLEKSIYRLMVIGAVDDYMKDYGRKEFSVTPNNMNPHEIYAALKKHLSKYVLQSEVEKYMPTQICNSYECAAFDCGSALIDFIYDKIEKRRRESIRQMLDISRVGEAKGEQSFREEILAFLERSEFSEIIEKLSEDSKDWFNILLKVERDDEVTKLLGACRRKLSENPDHSGVRLLEGLCLLASPNPEQGPRDITRAFAAMKGMIVEQKLRIAEQVLIHAKRLIQPENLDNNLNILFITIMDGDSSSDLSRFCYKNAGLDSEAHYQATLLLLKRTLETVRSGMRLHE